MYCTKTTARRDDTHSCFGAYHIIDLTVFFQTVVLSNITGFILKGIHYCEIYSNNQTHMFKPICSNATNQVWMNHQVVAIDW